MATAATLVLATLLLGGLAALGRATWLAIFQASGDEKARAWRRAVRGDL